jgi:acyl-CoA thioesterase I
MRSTRVATLVLLGGTLSLVVMPAACNPKSSPEIGQNTDRPQKIRPMPQESPFNAPHPITGPVRYVALGDSTGTGVGAREGGYVARLFRRIVARRPDSRLTNLCVSGATTSDVLHDQLERGLIEAPNFVTLGIGINDIGHGVSLAEFSKNYEEILSRLRSNTKAAIVVTNIPDISTAPRIPQAIRSEYHQLIVDFNKKLEEIAARYDVTLFDVYTITHQELPAHPEFFSSDGFHPSDKGYELWAERMWPTIARAIGESLESESP